MQAMNSGRSVRFLQKITALFRRASIRYGILVFSLLATLFINSFFDRQITEMFEDLLSANRYWADKWALYLALEDAIGKLNAPGNDIFASGDVKLESHKLQVSLLEYEKIYKSALSETSSVSDIGARSRLLENLKKIEASTKSMLAQERLIIASIRSRQKERAGKVMALMDRHYGEVRGNFQKLHSNVEGIQDQYFKRQFLEAHRAQTSSWIVNLLNFVFASLIIGFSFRKYLKLVRSEDQLRSKEQALQKALKEIDFYKYAIDQSAIVATTDTRGKILYVNNQFCKISGYAEEELLGADHRILNSGEMSKDFFKGMWKMISSGRVWRGEICNRAKDGRRYWVDTTIVPTVDSNGKVTQYTAIRYEITTRKKMEAELWATNEMQRAILESANFSVVSADVNGVIQTFNKTAEVMLGYGAEEMIGKRTPAIIHDESEVVDRARVLSQELGRAIEPGFEVFIAKARLGGADENEWTYVRKDGSRFPVRLSVTSLKRKDGQLAGFLGIAHDISESKRIHEQLIEANQVALSAAKAKAEFLANMSHEIRTPMNGIIGMCNLLLGTALDKTQAEQLKLIHHCASSLLDLINDILDFSKIEANRVELEYEPFPIRKTVQEVGELLSSIASQKGICLTCVFDESTPDWISGDITRFRQVLMNLVGNAIKFTERGSVRISTSAIVRGDGRHEVEISVKDTGIGISKATQANLFRPFSQADASTTRKFGGTGLGLVISRGFCEKMGGVMWLESELGKGSTFFFTVVGHEAEPLETEPDSFNGVDSEMASREPLRILVAEDNRVNQLVILGLLEKLGYHPDVALNGVEVLARLDENSYDVVLMDCHMPELDGYEATRQIIQKFGKSKRPRIIAVTASTMKEDIDLCYGSGMDGVVSKPITVPALVQALRGVSTMKRVAVQAVGIESLSARSQPSAFDKAAFIKRFEGLEDLARQAALDFLSSLPKLMDDLEDALAREDSGALEIAAHTLKGAISNFHAHRAHETAFQLEMSGRSKDLSKTRALFVDLRCQAFELASELEALYPALKEAA